MHSRDWNHSLRRQGCLRGYQTLMVVALLMSGCSGDQGLQTDSEANIPLGDTGVEADLLVEVSPLDMAVTETSVDSPVPELPSAPDALVDAVPEEGEFLYACAENKDCYSGYCVDAPEGGVCSKTCFDTNSCPLGWSCSQLSGQGDTAFICVPNDTYLCRPCADDDDCNAPGLPKTGVCRSFGDFGSICTRECSQDVNCPQGFKCEDVQPYGPDGPTLALCDSEDGEACRCTEKFVAEQASTSCVVENDLGTCVGEILCAEEGPLPACSALPATAEVCNGVDDDCDGVIDEAGAEGCTVYYLDTDGDGYGLGYGKCYCDPPDVPGEVWLLKGGDCNELVVTIHPGATEICNGFDDDCDGSIDEPGATGCISQFADEDGDGYGDEAAEACVCKASPFWTQLGGDCDDHDLSVSPLAVEVCDKVDNDCDGVVDEEGAGSCTPFFKDIDGDGFGVTQTGKCLCDPVADYTATQPNDCDETSSAINPSAVEVCNGLDDNCNQETDEGATDVLCPPVPNGSTICVGADGCELDACFEGWSDADGDLSNGCECGAGNLELEGMPGTVCQDPHFLGVVIDTGEEASFSDNVVSNDPNGTPDEDWYSFQAIDSPDPGGCDSFSVQVKFEHNPGGQFVLDIYKSTCAGADNICSGVTHYTESVNFFDETGGVPLGECPCAVGETDDVTAPGVQRCTDQTDTYYVRVYRKPGFETTCESYTLRASNGF